MNRRLGALLLTTLALTGAAGPVAAGGPPEPAGTSPSRSGYVVVRRPSTAAYTPAPKDRGNSEGGVNSVLRVGKGIWSITMPGLGSSGGHVQVTPMNAVLRRCIVGGWGGGVDIQIDIRCSTRTGAAADTPFAVAFTEGTAGDGGDSGRMSYVYNAEPSFDSVPLYQYSSALATIDIRRTATGVYDVVMPGLQGPGGHVQVSTYGSRAGCRPGAWGPSGSEQRVTVVCRTPAGSPTDARFDMLYLSRLGIEGFGLGRTAAHLWAQRPRDPRYRPLKAYRYSSAAMPSVVTRTARGRYSVALPGLPTGGVALVSAFGISNDRFCQLTSIAKGSGLQRTGVACFARDGSPSDSRFTLTWAK